MEGREIHKAYKMDKEKQTESEKNNTVIAKLTVINITDEYVDCDVRLEVVGREDK